MDFYVCNKHYEFRFEFEYIYIYYVYGLPTTEIYFSWQIISQPESVYTVFHIVPDLFPKAIY